MRAICSLCLLLLSSSCPRADAPAPRLLAHWRLENAKKEAEDGDLVGRRRDIGTVKQGLVAATLFNGRSSEIEIPSSPKLQLGTNDFTVSAWVDPDGAHDMPGDILSKFDPSRRSGFSLSIVTRQGVTHSQANAQQLQFGIDDGTEPKWTDRGRPGEAVYVHALAVHDGELFAGTCEPGKDQSGHVYRYAGEDRWADCGGLDKSNAVISLAVFEGKLYAGTGKYRTGGSALAESENANSGGRIFRFDDEGQWTKVGELPGVEAVGGLVVFRSRLYASSLYRPAGFFRFEKEGEWTSCPLPDDGKRVESMISFNARLYATSYDNGHVYGFNGVDWTDTGALGENTQCYGFAIHRGELFCSTWPSGCVYQREGELAWRNTGRLGEELEVMGMAVHNGMLYAGSLPLAEVYRYDGDRWTSTGRLDQTPDVKYRRAWTMAVFQGRLFVGTLPSGHVYSMEAGQCVTYDREFPLGGHLVAGQRKGDKLRLFIDGKVVAETEDAMASKLNLSNDVPLRIGFGPNDYFHGRIRDVRVHDGALSEEEIAQLSVP